MLLYAVSEDSIQDPTMRFGSHMSIAGGIERSVERGLAAGCEAIQIFVKSNNQWRARPFREGEPEAFREAFADSSLEEVVAHNCYLVNMASPDEELWDKSRDATRIELERCEALGVESLVLHPGSHKGRGVAVGIARLAEALDTLEGIAPSVRILLETTAGQGDYLGWRFEELRDILGSVADPARLRVCLDTCHVHAAGWDLCSDEGYEDLMGEIGEKIGLDSVTVLHVNDSKTPRGSRVDRHAHIGRGEIGLEGFRRLVNDPRWEGRSLLLETPKGPDLAEDRENLRILRELRGGSL